MVRGFVVRAGKVASLDPEMRKGEGVSKEVSKQNGKVPNGNAACARGVAEPRYGRGIVAPKASTVAARRRIGKGGGLRWVQSGGMKLTSTDPYFDDEGEKLQDVNVGIVGNDVMAIVLRIGPAAGFGRQTTCVEV